MAEQEFARNLAGQDETGLLRFIERLDKLVLPNISHIADEV